MSRQQQSPLIRYRYDALDRLSSHRQLDNAECQRFYCANHLVTEVNGDEHISIVQNGDQLLAQQRRYRGGLDSDLIATDQQRSVLNTLRAQSTRAIAYSPYGHRVFERGLSSLLGFNGQRPEPETGHYLLGNGYRKFNPVLMRFNRPDNRSPFREGGLNAYAYCQGDPINRSDPTGHRFVPNLRSFSARRANTFFTRNGYIIKPVKNVVKRSENLFTYSDRYKGGDRLNIYSHGGPGVVSWDRIKKLDPSALHSNLQRAGVNFEEYDSVRLLFCHSASKPLGVADVAGASFGDAFANLVGLPVKAYDGAIEVFASWQQGNGRTLKIGSTTKGFHYVGVVKSDDLLRRSRWGEYAPYRPVTYQPSLENDIRVETTSRVIRMN